MSLKCCACCSIKPLADFSGNQKKKVDGPRCLSCTRSMKPVVTSLKNGSSGSSRRCTSCKTRKDPSHFNINASTGECKDCSIKRQYREAERANEAARTKSAGACRVKDVKRRYGHLCEIPLEAYCEAGVAYSWNDYVTERDVQAASSAWDARSIAHDIDTQWGDMPGGGAYSDSNYYYGPGEYDYY